jgi:hypothetical protein
MCNRKNTTIPLSSKNQEAKISFMRIHSRSKGDVGNFRGAVKRRFSGREIEFLGE